MSKKISNAVSWLILIFAGFMLAQRLPGIWALYQAEGETLPALNAQTLDGAPLSLPEAGEKRIVILWASWCKPCDLELSRFRSAVDEGEIESKNVLALSFGEDLSVVRQTAAERKYPFPVAADPAAEASQLWKVEATPTVFHINADGTLNHASSGLSPFAILRARWFLRR